jgi:hypothetical protein
VNGLKTLANGVYRSQRGSFPLLQIWFESEIQICDKCNFLLLATKMLTELMLSCSANLPYLDHRVADVSSR